MPLQWIVSDIPTDREFSGIEVGFLSTLGSILEYAARTIGPECIIQWGERRRKIRAELMASVPKGRRKRPKLFPDTGSDEGN